MNSWKRIALFQLRYGFAGLSVGSGCMLGGIVLISRGVTESTSWTAKFFGAEINVSTATPGVCLFIIGLLIVFITKPNFKLWTTHK